MGEATPRNQSPPARMPRHVAVIMDGNGRWARARGLPRIAGHRAGTEALRRLIEACVEHGIPYLTIYAFSTENWQRPEHEVRALLLLVEELIERQLDELDKEGVRLRHVGWLDRVPEGLAASIKRAVDRTAHNDRLSLCVAFNYGARGEIVRAAQRIVADGVPAEELDEARFAQYLETAGVPDPDVVIRTAGEMRLSNFLLWQAAYAEFVSTPVLWPDFGREDLVAALAEYAGRERRFGARPGEPARAGAERASAAANRAATGAEPPSGDGDRAGARADVPSADGDGAGAGPAAPAR